VALRHPGIARELVRRRSGRRQQAEIIEAGFGDEPAVAARDLRGGSPAPSADAAGRICV